MSLMLNAQGR